MSSTEFERMTTPVALIIFNRAATTRKVLDVLRQVRPQTLFVIADGPREGVPDDQRLCAEARAVIDEIDWPCDVRRRFLNENLGCGHSPAQGLDWVFSQVETCIILEDDCAPDVSFFPFCQEMLQRYQDDKRVMMISGNNHLLNRKAIADSYLYSINTQTHGWATWGRAWSEYDFFMEDWPTLRSVEWLTNYLGNSKYADGWLKTFDIAYKEAKLNPKCSYWDFQWTYTCWKNHALNVIPCSNLVTNLGYGDNATHPTSLDHPLANLPVVAMSFPLKHPVAMIQNHEADDILRETVYGYRPLYKRIYFKLCRILKRIISGVKCK
jgi:hypothetical protein